MGLIFSRSSFSLSLVSLSLSLVSLSALIMHITGLEPLVFTPELNFVNIGERTNISGSRQFARLIKEEKYEDAVGIARQQVACHIRFVSARRSYLAYN